MKKALTLSIVIPAYNEERHLKACLESIAAQTEKPDEVIVVDNNSTDTTAKIARSFSFVKLMYEPKQGVVFARNTGFNAVSSTLIGRIDADTILPADWVQRIKTFYRSAQHANHAFSGGCYFYNIRCPHFTGWLQGQIAFRMNRLLLGHYILFGTNMALPRDLWQAVKLQLCQDPHIHEDLDLAIHLHRLGYPITYHEGVKVGAKMRRVRSDLKNLWSNLMWWPRTLRHHGLKTWVFGWIGACMLFNLVPLAYIAETIARLMGRPGLRE